MQATIHHRRVGYGQDFDRSTSAEKSCKIERSNVTTATTGLRLGVSGRRPQLSDQIRVLWLTKRFREPSRLCRIVRPFGVSHQVGIQWDVELDSCAFRLV